MESKLSRNHTNEKSIVSRNKFKMLHHMLPQLLVDSRPQWFLLQLHGASASYTKCSSATEPWGQ